MRSYKNQGDDPSVNKSLNTNIIDVIPEPLVLQTSSSTITLKLI